MNELRKSRKPSVAFSRRFSLNVTSNRKNNDDINNHDNSKRQVQKVMWNGVDATPLPLNDIYTASKYHLDDLRFNQDDERSEENKSQMDTFDPPIPWIRDVFEGALEDKDAFCRKVMGKGKPIEYSKSKNDFSPRSSDPHPKIHNQFMKQTKKIFLAVTESISVFNMNSSITPLTSDDSNNKNKTQFNNTSSKTDKEGYIKRYSARGAQTFHLNVRSMSSNTSELKTNEVGSMTSQFDDEKITNYDIDEIIENLTEAAVMTEGCLLPVESGDVDKKASSKATFDEIIIKKAYNGFLCSQSVKKTLSVLERAILQNVFSDNQIRYRGVKLVKESTIDRNVIDSFSNENASSFSLNRLFTMTCDRVLGRKVTCMCWDKSNDYIIAIGYGAVSKRGSVVTPHKDDDGFVMLWSIRNPTYPELVIPTDSPVTAMDFSEDQPFLLAVGLSDGRIVLFDTQQQHKQNQKQSSVDDRVGITPILDSVLISGRHMLPVSKVYWIPDESNHHISGEQLISISVDGRVLQWSLKKGLSMKTLVTLRKNDGNDTNIVVNQTVEHGSKKHDIAPKHKKNKNLCNKVIGLCIDFPMKQQKKKSDKKIGDDNSSFYLVGSDIGIMYKCSRSYVDQHLDVLKIHSGPITQVKISPFTNDVFLTSSADSTVKIWSSNSGNHVSGKRQIDGNCDTENLQIPAILIQPVGLISPINDICWSPIKSTLFAIVAEGRIELWDVSKSILDPLVVDDKYREELSYTGANVTEEGSSVKRTSVLFSKSGMNIVVGDEGGEVEIYRLRVGSLETNQSCSDHGFYDNANVSRNCNHEKEANRLLQIICGVN